MKTLDPLSGISAFLAVAECLNFSRAAEKLDMSRATISAQLQQLEQRLGVRLLQRTTRSVTLTEAGSAYHQALTGVLPQIREAERAALALQQEAVGRIRISAPPDLAQTHLAPLVADFLRQNPAIAVELDLSHDTVNLVDQGFDLAIRGTMSVEENVITRRLGASRVYLCASPDYLRAHGDPAHPAELAAHACLHFSPLRWGRIWQLRKDDDTVRIPFVPPLEVNCGMFLRSAALEGAGITLLPAFLCGEDIRAGRLVSVLDNWSLGAIPVHAVYPDNRHIAAKVRQFVAFLAKRLTGHPDFRSP